MYDKNKAYEVICHEIERGEIKLFEDIFKHIAHDKVNKDAEIGNSRLMRIRENPQIMEIHELVKLATLIGCDKHKLFDIVVEPVPMKKK